MCGRTACTLAPDDIQKACCYKDPKNGKFITPKWKDASNGGRGYVPSHNVCPTDITPVIVSGTHFKEESQRIMHPMMWGIIPPWHTDDYKSHKLTTNNCRSESLTESKLYKRPFLQGKRCVVVCDGFYEWQARGKGSKQPYFIYMPQNESTKIEDPVTWSKSFSVNEGWLGPNLMKMAAIFDTWKSRQGDEIHCYSILTLESNKTFSWLHHRMPAILDTEESVSGWLDFGQVDASDALKLVRTVEDLKMHPVSTLVNNSRNKDASCNKRVEEEKPKPVTNKSASFMKSWLQGSTTKRRSDEQEPEEPGSKIPKNKPN